MAKVQIADVIEPTIFQQYVIERSVELSALFRSGIISTDQRIDRAASAGGRTVNMPFWNTLTGNSEVLSDSGSLTPQKITASQDVAVLHLRGKAWSANDLASTVSGDDPMGAIATQVATWWNEDQQDTLISTLRGVFATALAATHVNDIATEDGATATDAAKFGADAFLQTVFLLGDRQSDFRTMVVHSVVYQRMLALDLIDFIKPSSASNAEVPTYLGRRIIIDDGTLTVAGATSGFKYYSFIFGAGSIGYGEGSPEVPVETDRDSLAGDDILINRRHYILHPRGVKWVGTPAGAAPTNAELETGANWTKVYNDKNIRIAALVTNG